MATAQLQKSHQLLGCMQTADDAHLSHALRELIHNDAELVGQTQPVHDWKR